MKKVLLNLVFFCALACFAEAQEFKVADIFSQYGVAAKNK